MAHRMQEMWQNFILGGVGGQRNILLSDLTGKSRPKSRLKERLFARLSLLGHPGTSRSALLSSF